jgi:hypothetical protein
MPCLAFEPGSHTPLPSDPLLPSFASNFSPLELTGFVDASHATCPRTRRSVTGFCLCLAGAAIAYKTKVQPAVATISTEAELIAAVYAAKVTKHLCAVLHELGFTQAGPAILHEDNQAAINMIIMPLAPRNAPATLTSNTLRFKSGVNKVTSSCVTHQVSSTLWINRLRTFLVGPFTAAMPAAPWATTAPS